MAVDKTSETWREILAFAQQRISAAHQALEAHGLDQAATEFHRGDIAAMRDLLAIGEENKRPPIPDAPDYQRR